MGRFKRVLVESMRPSDEALIHACRQGDEKAWETLVKRYERLVFSIPRKAGLDQERAAEVFQQVFSTLVVYLDRIEQPERIAAWLVTTARRETWRFSQLEPMTHSLEDESQTIGARHLSSSDPLPDAVVQQLEEQNQIHLALAELDGRCRQLLHLLFFRPDPPSYTEIATELNISEGSIGPTRIRCLKKLRQLLGKLDDF